MLKSMTGFAETELDVKGGRMHLVARTLNGRYLEARAKLPSGLAAMEEKVLEEVKAFIRRGRVDITISWRQGGISPRIDRRMLAAYVKEWRQAVRQLKLAADLTPGELMRLPGVLETREGGQAGPLWQKIRPALRGVLAGVERMRKKEGAATAKDLRRRLTRLGRLIAQTERLERQSAAAKKNSLSGKIEKLAGREARVAAWDEVVRIVERMNVDEELQRARAHLDYFSQCMRSGEPVGGKLDYIVQELLREVNTIGSKAEDSQVRRLVVEMKEELNRVREQVQNVE